MADHAGDDFRIDDFRIEVAEERAARRRDGDLEDDAAAGSELAQLLRDLSTTIDEAHKLLNSAAGSQSGPSRSMESAGLQSSPEHAPAFAPTPKPRSRRRAAVVLSSAGALALFGWIGWRLYDPALLPRMDMQASAPVVEVEEPPATTFAAVQAAAAQETMAAEKRTKEEPAPLPRQVQGRAGEPIPLTIALPQAAAEAEVSFMIKGIPEGASLSNGKRVGSDTWVLSEQQAPSAALLVPENAAPGRFVLNVLVITSDGQVPETRSIAATVEPMVAPAAQAMQPAGNPAPSGPPPAAQEQLGATPDPATPDPATPDLATPGPMTATPESALGQQAAAGPTPEAPAPSALPPLIRQGESRLLENEEAMLAEGEAAARAKVSAGRPPEPVIQTPAEDLAAQADGPVQPEPSSDAAPKDVASAGPTAGPPEPQTEQAPQPQPPAVAAGAAPSGESITPTRTAKVNTHVNMRAKPDNDAAVVTVVPAGRSVGVVECRHWCEVVYEGQHGWIYKSFVGGNGNRRSASTRPVREPRAASAPRAENAPRAASAPPPKDEPGLFRRLGSGFRSIFRGRDAQQSAQ